MDYSRFPPSVFLILLALLISTPPGEAKKKQKDTQIKPGALVISAEEQVIREDPAAGIEHAVILLEETARNENLGSEMQTRYHARIKILSNEARELADIEIPIISGDTKLKDWWARVILPDGKLLEVPQEELEVQSLASIKGAEARAYKAALPGVVPGCVIDYGYELREDGYYPYDRITLQRRYLVREVRFDWKPTTWLQGAYYLSRTEALDVQAKVGDQEITVIGRNLPPVLEEPLMPPDHAVRAALILYYMPMGTDFQSYWEDLAQGVDLMLEDSMKRSSMQKLIAEMNLPREGKLEQRLIAAYEWMGANITRTGLRTFEEIETDTADDDDENRDPVAALLDSREGSRYEIQQVFIGLARTLGAEADLVFVADRNNAYFNPNLKTMRQFDGTLVAVRQPGEPDEDAVLLDPCSGLPYGAVPWWYMGTHGMLMAKTQPRAFPIMRTDARENVSDARVALSFAEDNEAITTKWVQLGSGQVGLDERRYLRRLSPDERTDRLDSLCGASPDTDIVSAEVVGLDELGRDLELRCETESWNTQLDDEIGRYRMEWTGPWLRQLPDLPDESRTHPVVFDFPRTDMVTMDVKAPDGFVPDEAPPPVELEREVGRYAMRITRNDDGFTLQRVMVLYPIALPAEHYPKLRSFLDDVRKGDRTQLSFIREDLVQ